MTASERDPVLEALNQLLDRIQNIEHRLTEIKEIADGTEGKVYDIWKKEIADGTEGKVYDIWKKEQE